MSETLIRYTLVALLGGTGAVSRYALDGMIDRRNSGQFPWSTLTINVLGSFALGLLIVWTTERFAPHTNWRVGLGVGFLAAFTTFSTFSYDTVRLAEDGAWTLAGANIAANVTLGIVALYGGLQLARAI